MSESSLTWKSSLLIRTGRPPRHLVSSLKVRALSPNTLTEFFELRGYSLKSSSDLKSCVALLHILGRQPLFNVAVTGTALRKGHALTKYQIGVCFGVATHQLNLYFLRRERDSTCKRHLTCAEKHEGRLHTLNAALGRPRCGHTSSHGGQQRRYHPLKWL